MSEEYKVLQKDFQDHEKDFAGFKAVSEERNKNINEKLDLLIRNSEKGDASIQVILDTHAELLRSNNDDIIKNDAKAMNEIGKIKEARKVEQRNNKTWIAVGVGLAALLAPITAIIFEKIFLGG